MTIEDIIYLYKKHFKISKLVYLKIKKKTYYKYAIAMLFFTLVFIFPFILIINFENHNYIWLLLCIPSFVILCFLIITYTKKIEHILKDYIIGCNFNDTKNSHFLINKNLISHIQYLYFEDYINKMGIKISKDEIDKIIEALKYEISATKYTYQSLAIIITLFTALISKILISFFSLETNFNEIIKSLGQYTLALLIISIVIIGFEKIVVKDFIILKRNTYQKLIRILENYRLNKEFL